MNAIDFQFDGKYLSDYNCIICSFDDGKSPTTISMGSEISFTKTPVLNGKYFMITEAKYDSCIEVEFSICKDPDTISDYEDKFFTVSEQRNIMRWLNRTEMCEFSIIDDEYNGITYEGSFNVDKIELNGKVIGMNLRFTSNRPFGFADRITYNFVISSNNGKYAISDASDEIGHIYPTMIINLSSSGDLKITNSFDGTQTIIKNCVSGEQITFDNMVIETTNVSHSETIMNDFNFKFPKLCNSYNTRRNNYTFSLPCSVSFSYRPIRKVGL